MNNKTHFRKITILFLTLFIFSSSFNFAIPSAGANISTPKASVSGSYRRIADQLYVQVLGQPDGLAVISINSIDGQTNATDLIIAGTVGIGSWRGLQGYYSNTSTSLSHMMNDNTDPVTDIVKFIDQYDDNTDIIYGERGSDSGRIVRQRGVNPSYSDGVEIYPEWQLSTDPIMSLAIGNFDDDPAPEVVAIADTGMVYGINHLSIAAAWTKDLDIGVSTAENRHVKNLITAIDNLDEHGAGWQDVIVGHVNNVTAISTNASKSIIWGVDIGSRVSSVLSIPDVNNDSRSDVVVVTRYGGIYLLNGSNGGILSSNTSAGSLRDVRIFNDYNDDGTPEIITGNYNGDILVWDVNPDSESFGNFILNVSFYGNNVKSILNVGDLNEDGKDEYAIGGYRTIAVLNGNATSQDTFYWGKGGLYSVTPGGAYIDVVDIAMMDDQDNDGYDDFAITGGGHGQGALFIFSSQGILEFSPDLITYSGKVDSNCSGSGTSSVFSIMVKQNKGFEVSAEVIIDDVAYQMVSLTSDWDEGVNFTYTTQLSNGVHTYRFIVNDTAGDTLLYPNAGSFNGPQVGGKCSADGNGDGDPTIDGMTWELILVNVSIAVIAFIIINKKRIHRVKS